MKKVAILSAALVAFSLVTGCSGGMQTETKQEVRREMPAERREERMEKREERMEKRDDRMMDRRDDRRGDCNSGRCAPPPCGPNGCR